MNLSQAQKICQEIEAEYAIKRLSNNIKWTDVFGSEQEMLSALGKIYIPKSRTAPAYTFKGYELIYSYAYYVQRGWKLSDKQITQCKRLAVEIKKAAEIAEYKF